MNRKSLGKKSYRLWGVAAMAPAAVVVYLLFQKTDPADDVRAVFLALGAVLFFGFWGSCLYFFNKDIVHLRDEREAFGQESRKRNAELDALRDLTEKTRDGIAADELLRLILDKAMQVIAVRNGSVFLVDSAEPDGLRLVAARPPMVIKNDEGDASSRHTFVKSVIENGKALRISDIEQDPRTQKSNNPKYGSPSFLSMPAYKSKQVIAVMNLANKVHGGIFTEGDERILTIMLGAIGVGIENSGLRALVRVQSAQIKNLSAGFRA